MRTVPPHPPAADLRERALEVLCSGELDPIVEMVVFAVGEDTYEARAVDGRVRFRRRWRPDGTGSYDVEDVEGRDPLANTDPGHLSPLAVEQANVRPDRTANAYPLAHEQIAQVFDHPSAPDLCVIHTAAHFWGHRGEHGSIDVVQARAPFIVAGAGVRHDGFVPASCRLVDVAPTICALLGTGPTTGVGPDGMTRDGLLLARQCGAVVAGVIDPAAEPPEHVVGILFDGANANVLYELATAGELPNVAALIAEGTAFGHGAVSSLPTVTLANHTAALTGCWPGHHGVLHNAWFDRATGERAVTNSPDTWPTAMRWLSPGTETVHHAVRRSRPDALCVAVNEPCDAGAHWSTFGVIRSGGSLDRPPPTDQLPHTTHRFARPVKDYRWSSRVDHTGVDQAVAALSGALPGHEGRLPTFLWVNFTLTDAAFHEGGPYSEIAEASLRDTDGRLGRVLGAVEDAGIWDRTAFVLVADHGMEEADPEVRGDWGDHLRAAGIPHTDEGFGFIYLGV